MPKDLLKETERIALMMTNLELSNHPTFMSEFIAAMFLPHTDTSAFPQVMEKLQPDAKGESDRKAR